MSKVIDSNEKKARKKKAIKIALIATAATLAGGCVAYKKSEGFKKVVDSTVSATGKLFKKKAQTTTTEETVAPTTKKEYNYDGYNRKKGGYSSDHRHFNN